MITSGSGSEGGGEFLIAIPSTHDDQHEYHSPHPIPFNDYSRMMHFLFTGTLVVMYAPLVSLVQLMFQNEGYSPFKTHGPFMITSAGALTIATITSGLLFYVNNNKDSQIRKLFGLTHYMILKTAFCLSGILAPLALLLVLFIRDHNHHWIGYLIVCAVIGVVVASNLFGYIKLRGKKDHMAHASV